MGPPGKSSSDKGHRREFPAHCRQPAGWARSRVQSPSILRFQILNSLHSQRYLLHAIYDLLGHRSTF